MNKKFIVNLMLGALMLTGLLQATGGVKDLTGAGATFPYPLYARWFDIYHNETGIQVNYQAIGSGGGIRQLLNKTVDFGGTDAFMNDRELAKSPENPILHFPTCLGAVVITYNIPGNPELKLTPKVISGIFLGKITRWNDPKLVQLNPEVKLPSQKIVVVHRSDGSGTTFVFSDYLSKVSKEWARRVGKGKSLRWPVGLGGKGNPGVAGLIKQIRGSIGYVELAFAEKNNLPYASIKNKHGKFIKPTLKSISLAAKVNIPPDTRVSITDTEAPEGYPIASFTWIIFYREQNYGKRSYERAKELINLFWWMIHQGQQYNENLLYGKLPAPVIKTAEKIIKSVTYNGKPILR